MTRSRIAGLLVVAAVLLAAPTVCSAQIRLGVPVKTAKPKLAKFKGEVVAATARTMTVKSRENERLIRTFTFSVEVQEQMAKIIDKGGYQVGDKVEIEHEPGVDVAIKLKGKPSKPR